MNNNFEDDLNTNKKNQVTPAIQNTVLSKKSIINNNDLKKEDTNIVFTKSRKTYLNSKVKYNHIIKRNMFLSKIKFTKAGAGMLIKYYSVYSVTYPETLDAEKQQDPKDPKNNHPNVKKSSCHNDDCSKKNCAKDNSSCDKETLKVEKVAHLTQSPKGVEASKTVIELPNHTGPRGGSVYAVVLEKAEPIPEQEMYKGYMYSDTVAIQKDENTAALNKHINNNKEENNKHE